MSVEFHLMKDMERRLTERIAALEAKLEGRRVSHTHTHTYALMGVSKETFEEIKAKLLRAGYQDQIHDSHGGTLDMHGIALVLKDDPDLARQEGGEGVDDA